MNRATRRAVARQPQPRPEATLGLPLHIGTGNTGGRVEISELAARILVKLLAVASAPGSQTKFELAFAERELEQALAALNAANEHSDAKEPTEPVDSRSAEV